MGADAAPDGGLELPPPPINLRAAAAKTRLLHRSTLSVRYD